MQVSQVAYDRFVVELPPADAEYRPLADPETVAETAAWLWDFGPTPLVAVVGYDGAAPTWLSAWSPRSVRWLPADAKAAAAVVLNTPSDLEGFLAQGAPHDCTVLLWPSRSESKTHEVAPLFEALMAGGSAWRKVVDAQAKISKSGERFDVEQVEQS